MKNKIDFFFIISCICCIMFNKFKILIIPNIFMFINLLCAIFGIYGHSREEEKSLIKIYGEEYEIYKKRAGRFLPKIKRN